MSSIFIRKTLQRSSKSWDCVTFRVFYVSSVDFTTLLTSFLHDLIKAKVLSLMNLYFNRESKTYLCTSDKADFFFQEEICLVLMLHLRWVMWSFYFPNGKHVCNLVALLDTCISTNSVDFYRHWLYSTYRGFIFILLWEGLHKSKSYELIGMFHDISRYVKDLFITFNPELDKHIADVYPSEFQMWIKQILQTKKIISWTKILNVIGSDIYFSVYNKRNDFGCPIDNLPWLSVDAPRLVRYLHFAVG